MRKKKIKKIKKRIMSESKEIIWENNSRKEFKAYINSEFGENSIVLFHATWCKPCNKMKECIKKNIKKLNREIIYVDVDKSNDIKSYYKIRSYPTLISFKDGVSDYVMCSLNEKELIKLLERKKE